MTCSLCLCELLLAFISHMLQLLLHLSPPLARDLSFVLTALDLLLLLVCMLGTFSSEGSSRALQSGLKLLDAPPKFCSFLQRRCFVRPRQVGRSEMGWGGRQRTRRLSCSLPCNK